MPYRSRAVSGPAPPVLATGLRRAGRRHADVRVRPVAGLDRRAVRGARSPRLRPVPGPRRPALGPARLAPRRPPARSTAARCSPGSPMTDEQDLRRAERHLLRYGAHLVAVRRRAGGRLVRRGRLTGGGCLDFTSGQMSAILGHSHPEIVEVVTEMIGRLDHLFSGMLSPTGDRPGRGARRRWRPGWTKVLLLTTGAESNEAALRLAKVATGGWEVVGFAQSWHGMTGAAAAATYAAGRRGHGPAPVGSMAVYRPQRLPASVHGRATGDWTGEPSSTTPSTSSTARAAAAPAAFIAEPVLSSGGILDLPPGYLAALRAALPRAGRCCWCSTRPRPASGGPAPCSPSSATASCPTSSRCPRRSAPVSRWRPC